MKKSKPKPYRPMLRRSGVPFLYEGMLVVRKTWGVNRSIEKMESRLCRTDGRSLCILAEVWRQIEPRWYEAQFPGVFEYEVISPLGVIIGDYILLNKGSLPPHEVVRDFVRRADRGFFYQQTQWPCV
jgi:hypothetical protein